MLLEKNLSGLSDSERLKALLKQKEMELKQKVEVIFTLEGELKEWGMRYQKNKQELGMKDQVIFRLEALGDQIPESRE